MPARNIFKQLQSISFKLDREHSSVKLTKALRLDYFTLNLCKSSNKPNYLVFYTEHKLIDDTNNNPTAFSEERQSITDVCIAEFQIRSVPHWGFLL